MFTEKGRRHMNFEDVDSMPRPEKVILFVLGTVEKFKKMGFTFHQSIQLSEQGRLAYQELIKNGFTPTESEIESVVYYLREQGKITPTISSN
jgi:hypothetical protein